MKCIFVNLGKHFGGAENQLMTIIRSWNEYGNEAVVLTRKDSKFSEILTEKMPNIQVEQVLFTVKDIIRIKRLIKASEIDMININGINSGVFIRLVNPKVPIVTTVHSNADLDRAEKAKIIRKAFVAMENKCLKKSKNIIVVSDAIKELLVDRGINKDKVSIVYNGVKKIEYPDKLKSVFVLNDNKLKICFIGRLEKVKGCQYLLEALGQIRNVEYVCDIYGEGSLKQELEELSNKLMLNNRVCFKGFSDKVRTVLPEYHIVVLPSLFEAFPLTIPEAMNSKTIIVCSDAGGLPWIIKDKINGYIFKSKDSKELSAVLEYIYKHPDEQTKVIDRALMDFETKYTEEIMVKNTFKVFSKAMI